eukprot:9585576-Lingulodinium_polyedra.AAC.3
MISKGTSPWLPDSNSRLRDIAHYFLEAIIGRLDARFGRAEIAEALEKGEMRTQGNKQKKTSIAWSQKVFCFITRSSLKDKVPTRLRAHFAEIYLARAQSHVERLTAIKLQVENEKIDINWSEFGVYRFGEEDEDGRIKTVQHSFSATVGDLPDEVIVNNEWIFENNWSEEDAALCAPKGKFKIEMVATSLDAHLEKLTSKLADCQTSKAIFDLSKVELPAPDVIETEMGPGAAQACTPGPSASSSPPALPAPEPPTTPMKASSRSEGASPAASPEAAASAEAMAASALASPPIQGAGDASDALALVLGGSGMAKRRSGAQKKRLRAS